jgi:O26-antigen biosynthesis N-acetyl-L-fucosamine transferase
MEEIRRAGEPGGTQDDREQEMQILLIVVYYPPSPTSAARMIRELAQEYVRQGHRVIVATPSGAIAGRTNVTEEDGVTVLRVRAGDLKGSNRLVRMWRESRLSRVMWRKAAKFFYANPCDLIIYYSPTIFFGELVRRLKCVWGCPSYLVLRDIFPKWAVDAGVLREGLRYRYLKRKELEQYSAASVIGAEAPGDLRYFREETECPVRQVEVLYNWMDTRQTPRGAPKWRKKLGLDNKVVFFYGGNIGVAQDLDNVVRLAAGLREHVDIFFLLIGTGTEVKRLNGEIERQGLTNIAIHPPLAQDDYMECLSEFDVGLVSLDGRLKSNNFTGKLLGYVLCGKPVLASLRKGHDLAELLERFEAGFACENGDDERLRSSALLLASDAELRRKMGNSTRSLGETIFSVEKTARQILSHFSSGPEYSRVGTM